ncbi:hypothetical protein V6N13_061827 [Hibiscus sabdariffa]|uniref:Uncharacterized protein n=1 Tax=Hibiscus sabdariffa TaxID=183260 RepID=A0ABR2NJR6_9ROSI
MKSSRHYIRLQMYWVGTLFPQLFRKRFKGIGRFMLMPNTLALTAVHRQTAASRSSKPWMMLQHGFVGTLPSSTSTKLSRLRHPPRFKGSHLSPLGSPSPGRITTGFVVQEEVLSTFRELTKANKTRLRERSRAVDALRRRFQVIEKTICFIKLLVRYGS